MTARELRQNYLDFFKKKRHREIPPALLVPVDDPTTLFTGSGMQQLIPYLSGEPHPLGKRLVDCQICFRAEDLEKVGDNRHTTFFEMLGNWSLGNYFKKEQLAWFFQFLTEKVGLAAERLYVSVFEGNEIVPRDEESIAVWRKLFKTDQSVRLGEKGFDPKIKIYTYSADKNWWSRAGNPDKMPVGEIGGPDSEVFYDFGAEFKFHENSPFVCKPCHINCNCGRFLEIGNSVFIEYQKLNKGFAKLPQRNVDFGGGLERILASKFASPDIFKTELFWPVIEEIGKFSNRSYEGHQLAMRMIADHLKGAVFMMAEGLEPGNKAQGYLLRRLLRRAAVKMKSLDPELKPAAFSSICAKVIEIYKGEYSFKKIVSLKNRITAVLNQEMSKFAQSLDKGLKEIEKHGQKKINGKFAFNLYQTYGFPFEIIQELCCQEGQQIDKKEFDQEFARHQRLSRTAAKGMFKGGLADHSKAIIKLHTATHLLHAALRKILGTHVQQIGSNITQERLRFDFTHPRPLSQEELEKVEVLINDQIKEDLPVKLTTMSLEEARKAGALAFFGQKYPGKVNVYEIAKISKEVCAGPHVNSTGQIGGVKIIKEVSAGAGKRRIYATEK